MGCNCDPAGSTFTVSDSSGLTWQNRTDQIAIGSGQFLEEWYAIATHTLSSDSITISTTGSSPSYGIIAFAIYGANTSRPFDTNTSLPTAQANDASCPRGGLLRKEEYPCNTGVSTSNANDLAFQIGGDAGSTLQTGDSGTLIAALDSGVDVYAQYAVLTSTLSSQTPQFGVAIKQQFGAITDAVVEATPPVLTTLYSYDKASNIIGISYPDNYNLTYTYNGVEEIKSVGSIAAFNYTLDGDVASVTYGNGVVTTYSYNSRDMPTNITSKSSTGSTLLSLNYTYDNVGNVLKIDNQNYSYNDLNELTSGNGTWGDTTYSYDAVGNMVQMVNGSSTTDYSYGSYNELTSAGSTSYTYNNDGDMVTETSGSNTWNYHYNYQNELTSVVLNGVTVENDTYNPDGQRMELTTGSYSLVFMSQGTNILYENNLTSGVVTDRFYANGMVLGEDLGGSMEYYQLDALGNVMLTTYSTGSTAFSANYSPFGVATGVSGFELLQYSAKPYDTATGLYYFGARFYSPYIGRFITEDTYQGSLSDPLSQNRYVYAEDNPMKYIDPTGNRIVVSIGGNSVAVESDTTSSAAASTEAIEEADESTEASDTPPPSPPPSSTVTSTPASVTSSSSSTAATTSSSSSSGSSSTSSTTVVSTTTTGTSTVSPALSTTASSMTSSPNCFYSECPEPNSIPENEMISGTIAVLSIGAGILFAAATPFGGGYLTAAFAVFFLAGGINAAVYTYEEGPKATPKGALVHVAEGLPDLISFIWDSS